VGDLQALSVSPACLEFAQNNSMVILKPRHGYVPKVLLTLPPSHGYVPKVTLLTLPPTTEDGEVNHLERFASFRKSDTHYIAL